MSQSSILVEDGGNGSQNPHEDSVRGRETEAKDPELDVLSPTTKRTVMHRNLQIQRDHPVAWANGTKD